MEHWTQLGRPAVAAMLAEIAANDLHAANLAQAVWEILVNDYPQADQDTWREQLALAVLSYRSSFGRSRIGTIAADTLRDLQQAQRFR